ncbi:xanthine dehydrogenase family protein subunit M [Actinocrispum sp. NPDC049592]|uniref:FAD binding domain-containing protein n=1 Tax=Actinocrispum sp. NPDC049592 TaxID=3154835 RepID=UPI00341763CE
MKDFAYTRARSVAEAVSSQGKFVSGGTDLLNLMKDGVESHDLIVDINGLPLRGIAVSGPVLSIGALARMSDVASHPLVRQSFPVLSEALLDSASPQIRNMAAVGGNLLQRTRCGYFRDIASPCNKRVPGSGCPALDGENRGHAIFGGGDQCIAVHPSDLAVSLLALDASVRTSKRVVRLDDFYLTDPVRETVLEPGELITAIEVPVGRFTSRYLKLRDRATFEFAVVSVAAALDLRGRRVCDARLTFGGVAPRPWRSTAAEDALRGKDLSAATIAAAASAAVRGAVPRQHNGFKVELVQRAIKALLTDLGSVR